MVDEEIPLTEDILKKKAEFVKSWVEFAADGAGFKPIVEDRGSEGVIRVVGANETLYILSAWCVGQELANASTHGNVTISISNSQFGEEANLVQVKVDHTAGQHGGANTASVTFPMPLRLDSPADVRLIESGMDTPSVRGGFTGFIVSKRIN